MRGPLSGSSLFDLSSEERPPPVPDRSSRPPAAGGPPAPDGDSALRPLPTVCAEFSAESECEWEDCPHLHLCPRWLAGRCPVLRRCPLPHSLRTAHNLTVLRAAGWQQDERHQLRRWLFFQARCERLEATGLPPLCVSHARGACGAQPCDALHMCPEFLIDTCAVKRCTRGHDLIGDDNNRLVLARHGHDNMPVRDLLTSIRESMIKPLRLL
ncbi:Poly [ADP-ribose] polymerase 12 [Amphibalanus amphitrite]|uniref:Poly [ADP-ribose] polymerase 12 n=1 Tax=Amphibalanus amphitrite TaxID=1232801 RepID=A0A6A4V3P8_AMPAM|nr:Poly [ADP-ribose] polymerase 12 [Amphibalanus amphitrite]